MNTAAQKNRTVKHLKLGDNNIHILPYGFVHLNLQTLRLYGNKSLQFPLRNIAESGSDAAVLAFFADLRKGSVPVRHFKVMLVGHGRAGKSTLAKALQMKPEALRNLLQELKDKAGLLSLCCVCLFIQTILVLKALIDDVWCS